VHLVSFIIRIYHDAQSHECQICIEYLQRITEYRGLTVCTLYVSNCSVHLALSHRLSLLFAPCILLFYVLIIRAMF